jgi:hypothetical protein
MRYRCSSPKSPSYKWYGAKGVKVCDRWLNSFENFLADMGEVPDGMTIDRINHDGDYEPSNCRWATPHQQNYNRQLNPGKRTGVTNVKLTKYGKYAAYTFKNGKNVYVATFDTLEEAEKVATAERNKIKENIL